MFPIAGIEISDFIAVAPPGAIGISGLASSGNLLPGQLATVENSSFIGGITDLQNITNQDVRWNFSDNSPTPDTLADALISLNGNATATVIPAVDTPTLVAGTWVDQGCSLFACSAAGRVTYIGERDGKFPIDIAVTIRSDSGTNKDIHVYLALNGAHVADSGKQDKVGVTDPTNISLPWQLNLSENDYLEVFVENNSDAIDLVVIDATLRVK